VTPSALYLNNDLTLTLTGLRKADTGAYLDATAVVAYEITEEDSGDAVASGSFSYVALSSGNFQAVVQKTALTTLVAGRRYVVTATAAQDGYDGTWAITLPARSRGRT
jgi:hypothetical protein